MTIVEKKLKPVLRQNEPHAQIKIMANHGPLCKQVKNDKRNILKSATWKSQ